ncbi:PaaI family thioesterase [Actinophytocola sp. NPDC049390]|uniref:PaaI family thioesterase n=1 Tax=Actinophytocola sp. NPDC049390 TaxID=3363894 RepID=UPI00378D238E
MTGERRGHFWDAVEGRAPMPAATTTLGWKLVDADTERGEIEVSFEATEDFLNPAGTVQGGFLTAMLDDTMGPALAATLDPGQYGTTIELKVSFLRPAKPGRLVGRGRIVHRGGTIAFLAGELLDESGQVVAVGSSTTRILRTG